MVQAHTLTAAAPPCDPDAIARALIELDGQDRAGPFASEEFLRTYHRRALAGRLAAFLDEVVGSRALA